MDLSVICEAAQPRGDASSSTAGATPAPQSTFLTPAPWGFNLLTGRGMSTTLRTEMGEYRGEEALQRGPHIQTPLNILAPSKTALSCFEPLFLGPWGGFVLPPCKPLCLEERGDKGRGRQGTAKPARPQHPQGSLSLLASGQSSSRGQEAAQLIHPNHGTFVPLSQACLCSTCSCSGVSSSIAALWAQPWGEMRQLEGTLWGPPCPARRRRRRRVAGDECCF